MPTPILDLSGFVSVVEAAKAAASRITGSKGSSRPARSPASRSRARAWCSGPTSSGSPETRSRRPGSARRPVEHAEPAGAGA